MQDVMKTNLVDEENGLVSCELFTNQQIFDAEIERIFNKVWLYVGHESEIREPGNFVTRSLAGEPVIVIRGDDSQVHVLLNSCRHRGVKVCRADSGTARRFACPYHGWVYGRTGDLVSTSFDGFFPEGTDFSEMGLIRVPRVSTYKGLIFASWNADVVELDEYLGDFKFYLDMIFARTPGGMEVLGPPQRSRVKANWKTAAINFGTDTQHIATTHRGPMFLRNKFNPQGPVAPPGRATRPARQITTAPGHNITLVSSSDDAPPFADYNPDVVPLFAAALDDVQHDILNRLDVVVATVFPNMSFVEQDIVSETFGAGKCLILRLWQPISATELEVNSWCLAEQEASPEYKAESFANGIRVFGIAGTFEQDDVELWTGISQALQGRNARSHPFNFQTALPALNKPLEDFAGPGEAYPVVSEVTQFKWLMHWKTLMGAA